MSYTQWGILYDEWYVIGENKFVVGDYNISYDSAKDVMILDAYGSIVELSKSSSEPVDPTPTPSEGLSDVWYGNWQAEDDFGVYKLVVSDDTFEFYDAYSGGYAYSYTYVSEYEIEVSSELFGGSYTLTYDSESNVIILDQFGSKLTLQKIER